MRLDLLLVQKKLASSRTQAQELIKNGFVYILKEQSKNFISKSNYDVSDALQEFVFIEENTLQKFVSRGALKLESALDYLHLRVKGFSVLDVGQSTGGFTDCLLQREAAIVVGIDVGQGQLHNRLKSHPQVHFFESLHVNQLPQHSDFLKTVPAGGFDLVVADVSFISLTQVMPWLKPYLKAQAPFLFLVKPQFEAGPNALDKNGVVKDEKIYFVVQNKVAEEAKKIFGTVIDYFKSGLSGKDGNQEFFIYGKNQT